MSLRVEELTVYYRSLRGDVKAVDGATFSIGDGEIMGLAGESGCGKSSLGKSLIRMDARMKHVRGRVELDGRELTDKATERTYYTARIRLDEKSLSSLPGVEVMAGMPVEVLIKTGRFTAAGYMLRPIMDSFNRAFRED